MKTIRFIKNYHNIIQEGVVTNCVDEDAFSFINQNYAAETAYDESKGCLIKSFIDLQVAAAVKNKITAYRQQFDKTFDDAIVDPMHEEEYKLKRFEIVSNYIIDEYAIKSIRDEAVEEMWYKINGVYNPNGKTLIEEISHLFYGKAVNQGIINKIILLTKLRTYVDRNVFFQNIDTERVAVANGILNLKTFTLEDNYKSNSYIFNMLPIKYDATADCPKFKAFVADILKDEKDILAIQEIFGYCLLPYYKYEKLFILTGNGRNGKSKLLQILKTIMGQQNIVSHSLKTLQEKDYAVAELHCKMANIGGDISSEALKYVDILKQLTGQDLITANRKFKSYVCFTNYAKQIFACNELPAIYDSSLGFWNRLLRIDFPYTFYEQSEYDALQDKTYAKIRKTDILDGILVESELSGILNWAIEGLKRLLKTGQFSNASDTLQVRNNWIRKSSSFFAFVQDNCEFSPTKRIESGVLNDLYSSYCDYHCLDVVDTNKRKSQINTFANKTITIIVSKNISGENIRYWKGIYFKQEYLDRIAKASGMLVTESTLATAATSATAFSETLNKKIDHSEGNTETGVAGEAGVAKTENKEEKLKLLIKNGDLGYICPISDLTKHFTFEELGNFMAKGIININNGKASISAQEGE